MKITYFAKTRELMGRDEDSIDFPQHINNIAHAIDFLLTIGEPFNCAFAERDKLCFALDNKLVNADARIENHRELAIFPPVTGG